MVVPARPEFLHLIRSVIISAGAVADLPIDVADDLCVAGVEAVSLFVHGGPRSEVVVELALDSAVASVRVSGPGPLDTTRSAIEGGLSWLVLTNLTDQQAMEEGPEGTVVWFTREVARGE